MFTLRDLQDMAFDMGLASCPECQEHGFGVFEEAYDLCRCCGFRRFHYTEHEAISDSQVEEIGARIDGYFWEVPLADLNELLTDEQIF